MPRRKDPTRELSITINDEGIRDALVLWVAKYHGFSVDIKQIKMTIDEKGKISATVAQRPSPPASIAQPKTEPPAGQLEEHKS
jgi:hypothetical protein